MQSVRQRVYRAMTATERPEIISEAFDDLANPPPLLLIMGAMASMLWVAGSAVLEITDAGPFVIRYDNRDTGQVNSKYRPASYLTHSTTWPDDAMRFSTTTVSARRMSLCMSMRLPMTAKPAPPTGPA